MEELQAEEEKLLNTFYERYKAHGAVLFDFSQYKIFSPSRDKDIAILNQVLQSLYLQGYIQKNLYTKTGQMSNMYVMLAEKAVRVFTKRMREEEAQKEEKEEKDLPKE